MFHRSESCYHCKYTLKTLVTNFNLSEKQRSTLFLNKTLPVLLRNGVYSVLHHAEPNLPVQFMYVDQHWWQRQQIMAETSFLCLAITFMVRGRTLSQQSLAGDLVQLCIPPNQWTHTQFPHTQIQLRVSNQCVFGLWENIGKVKNPPTQVKKQTPFRMAPRLLESMRQLGWFNNSTRLMRIIVHWLYNYIVDWCMLSQIWKSAA